MDIYTKEEKQMTELSENRSVATGLLDANNSSSSVGIDKSLR
jgi:hypothetical protein